MPALDVLSRHSKSWGMPDARLPWGLIVWTLFRVTLVLFLSALPLALPPVAALPIAGVLSVLTVRATLMLDSGGEYGRGLRWEQLELRRPQGSPRQWLLPALGFLVGSLGTALGTAFLFPPEEPQSFLEEILVRPGGTFVGIMVVGLLHPFLEEVVFRGWLFTVLSRWRGARVATLVANLLWALSHCSIARVPDLLLTGYALQYVRSKTGSLWSCAALHAAFNSGIVMAAGWSGDAELFEGSSLSIQLLCCAGLGVVGWGAFFWGMRRVGVLDRKLNPIPLQRTPLRPAGVSLDRLPQRPKIA